jgi:uncharacterized glyoxalase superfamily protein PhnB
MGRGRLQQRSLDVTDGMQRSDDRPVLSSVAPNLFVADVRAAADFFVGKLGFGLEFLYGDPPFYGEVRRDSARLALRCVDVPVFVGNIRARETLLSASITVETAAEIATLFQEFQTAGVPFHQALRTEPWGARTFIVADLDGNLVLFAGPVG